MPLLGNDKQLSYGEVVSPDRKWLAYTILDPTQIVVDSLADKQTQIRIPWEEEPTCVSCHTGVVGVDTNEALYRNARGHGNVYCSACHGSPHAMIPSNEVKDNYQAMQYQGKNRRVKTIGSCGVCHDSSRGDDDEEFNEEHGGNNPEKKTTCHLCHSVVPTDIGNWPHAYTWKDSN